VKDFRTHKKYKDGVFKTKQEIEQELHQKGIEHIYYVLSFGGGTQSAHLLEEHLQGKRHYDFIIFSDTGAEPQFIHDQIEWWKRRQTQYQNTTPFIITHHQSMEKGLEEMLMRYIHTDYQRFQMPLYFNRIDEYGHEQKAGIMPRQCTVDFKIIPVKQTARRLVMEKHGLSPHQRMPSHIAFIIDIGFSYDEIHRISTYRSPQYKYMYLSYPLVEQHVSTQESIDFLLAHNMPSKRSRCYLCPFNCDIEGMSWTEIIEQEPLSFLKACYFDEELRKAQRSGNKSMKSVPYFHYTRRPLKEVYQKEYEQLQQVYQGEFQQWLDTWMMDLEHKYRKTTSEHKGVNLDACHS